MTGGVNPVANNGTQNLEKIKQIFTTELDESQRSTFDFTFNGVELGQNKPDDKIYNNAQEYYEGLLKHKDVLVEKLGITSEQYDAFACMALSLASQETGFGYEAGYEKENDGGIDDTARNVVTWFRSLIGKGSASSGMTQMRLNDFIDGKIYFEFLEAVSVEKIKSHEVYEKCRIELFKSKNYRDKIKSTQNLNSILNNCLKSCLS